MTQMLSKRYVHYFAIGRSLGTVIVFLAITPGVIISAFANNQEFFGVLFGLGILLFLALIVALSYLTGWLIYKKYTYELASDGFRKQYGILNIKNTIIPYERIQNVDIRQPFVMRLFGLAEIHIQTAGNNSFGGISEGTLPGVLRATAESLQTELIARSKQASSLAANVAK